MLRILVLRMLSYILSNFQSVNFDHSEISIDKLLFEYWKKYFNNNREYLIALSIDKNDEVNKVICLSKGDSNSVAFPPIKFLWFVFRNKTSKLYLAHNHPGNYQKACKDDYLLTNDIINRCSILKIDFQDHFVFTDTTIFSMRFKKLI